MIVIPFPVLFIKEFFFISIKKIISSLLKRVARLEQYIWLYYGSISHILSTEVAIFLKQALTPINSVR